MRTQTIVSLPKLALAMLNPMSEVPNTKGFRLIGVLKDRGYGIPLHVEVDANGCHYLADQHNTHRSTAIFSGWAYDTVKTA